MKKSSGFSLVEMLVYVALVSVIFILLVDIVFSFSKSYEQLGALRAAEHTALSSMERMVRDIHSATSIDLGQSALHTSPGTLTLLAGATTTKFILTNGELRVSVNDVDLGPLSVSRGKITELIFIDITTPESQGIRIEMTVEGAVGSAVRSKKYITTAVLKNS